MVQVIIDCGGVRTPIDIIDVSDFDVFKFQVMSITDIAPADQHFSVRGLSPSTYISLRGLAEGAVVMVSRGSDTRAAPGAAVSGGFDDFGGDDALAAAIAASLGMAAPAATSAPAAVVPFARRDNTCTRVYLGSEEAVQPYREVLNRTTGMVEPICASCSRRCRPYGMQPGISTNFINTPFVCQCNPMMCMSSMRLTGYDILYAEQLATFQAQLVEKAEEQQSRILQPNHDAFQQRIQSVQSIVLMYEDPNLQEKGRAVVPVDDIKRRAAEMVSNGCSDYCEEDEFIRELNRWFKSDFFRWVDTLTCECGTKTVNSGGVAPSAEEQLYRAGVTELHQCPNCSRQHRFPRYNHPEKLIETRQGRCGEFANAFTFLCRCFGYSVRQVQDNADHVWTEFYSNDMGRWVHADACEIAFDAPLLYEQGWGKEIQYVTGVGAYEAADVTRRYTADYDRVKTQRKSLSELWLRQFFSELRGQLKVSLSSDDQAALAERHEREQAWLDRIVKTKNRSISDAEQHGRTTGSWEWRKARGELGENKSEQNKTSSDMLANPLVYLTVTPSVDGMTNLGELGDVSFDTSEDWASCGGLQTDQPQFSALLSEVSVTRSRAGYISSLQCSYLSKMANPARYTYERVTPRYGSLTYGDDVEEGVFFNVGRQRIVGARVVNFKTKQRVVGFSLIVEHDSTQEANVFAMGMKEDQIYNDDYEIEKYTVPKGHCIVSMIGCFEKDELVWIRFCYAPYASVWQGIVSQIRNVEDPSLRMSLGVLRTIVHNAQRRTERYHKLKKSSQKLNDTVFRHKWALDVLENCGFVETEPEAVEEKEVDEKEEVKEEPQGAYVCSRKTSPAGTLLYATEVILGLRSRVDTDEIKLDVHSFGCQDRTGIRKSWIRVNGHSYRVNSSAGGRGHGIVAFSPVGQLVVDYAATFDTWGDEKAGVAMAKFIRRIPKGHVVVVCVHDSAENHWRDAMEELTMLGIAADNHPQHRESFICVGLHLGFGDDCDGTGQPEWSVCLRTAAGLGPLRHKMDIPKVVLDTSPLEGEVLPIRLGRELRTIGAKFYAEPVKPEEKDEKAKDGGDVQGEQGEAAESADAGAEPGTESSETQPESAPTDSTEVPASTESATEPATESATEANESDEKDNEVAVEDTVDKTILFVEPVTQDMCGGKVVREYFLGHCVLDCLQFDYPFPPDTGFPILSFDETWSDEKINLCVRHPTSLEFVDTIGQDNMEYCVYQPISPLGFSALGVVLISSYTLGWETPESLPADAFFPNLMCVADEFVEASAMTGFNMIATANSLSLWNRTHTRVSFVVDDDEKNEEEGVSYIIAMPQCSTSSFMARKRSAALRTSRLAVSLQMDEFTPFEVLKEQIFIPPPQEVEDEEEKVEAPVAEPEDDANEIGSGEVEHKAVENDDAPPDAEPQPNGESADALHEAAEEAPKESENKTPPTDTLSVDSETSNTSGSRTASPRTKAANLKREQVQAYLGKYFRQLQEGCGNPSCTNEDCATAQNLALQPNEAAKRAVYLAQNHKGSKLCLDQESS